MFNNLPASWESLEALRGGFGDEYFVLIPGCPLGAGTAELGGCRGGGSDPAGTRHLPRTLRRPACFAASARMFAMRRVRAFCAANMCAHAPVAV